ncbi:MAG: DUF2249 domain-containing protein [Firmicutes bacterium]|nr:DUF2249 domain-containing protein [Bacillota bacterium]
MADQTSKTVTLDVRDDLRSGRDPFDKIMGALAGLGEQDRLVIINIFEPKPLYDVLASRGYAHQAERTPEGDWKITFEKSGAAS